MKTYNKPTMEIVESLSDEFCAVVSSISDAEAVDRVIIQAEDLLD